MANGTKNERAITLTELREDLADVLAAVSHQRIPVVVQRYRQPYVVIVDAAHWAQLREVALESPPSSLVG